MSRSPPSISLRIHYSQLSSDLIRRYIKSALETTSLNRTQSLCVFCVNKIDTPDVLEVQCR